MSIRIFWCHPRLREYRRDLFRMMNRVYSTHFLLQIPSDIDKEFDHAYTKKPEIISTVRPIPLTDIRKIYKGIEWADIYISSFILCSYTIFGIVIAKILRKRVIVWEELNFLGTDLKSRLRYLFYHILIRFIDAFYVLGEIQKTTLVKLGVCPEKIFVANEYPGFIYHLIAPKLIELPFNEEMKVILFLGRLIEFKGVIYLLNAFNQINKIRDDLALLIVGDGPLRSELERYTKTEGMKNIYFAGAISDIQQKAFLFKRCSLVVVPSITTEHQVEGGPIVVLEALSAGRPIIGTNALGSSTPFIQDGVNGFVVPEKDAYSLCEKINLLIDSPDINEKQVLDSFYKIRGYEYQFEKMQEAIASIL